MTTTQQQAYRSPAPPVHFMTTIARGIAWGAGVAIGAGIVLAIVALSLAVLIALAGHKDTPTCDTFVCSGLPAPTR